MVVRFHSMLSKVLLKRSTLPLPSGWYGVVCGSGDVAMLAQTVEQLVFEFTPLIMVNPLGESKMWYEIVEQPICCGLSRLVRGGVCLSEPCIMIHDHSYLDMCLVSRI